MHSKKIVHMDVKLQNVLVGDGEVYKVSPSADLMRVLARFLRLSRCGSQLGDLGTVAHLDGSMEITEGDNRYLSR